MGDYILYLENEIKSMQAKIDDLEQQLADLIKFLAEGCGSEEERA